MVTRRELCERNAINKSNDVISVLGAHTVVSVTTGARAKLGQFPSQVALGRPGKTICGGTIIHENHILTAARCVIDEKLQQIPNHSFRIVAGVLRLIGDVEPYTVEAIYIHPRYNPHNNQSDLAVIRVRNGSVVERLFCNDIATI